MVVVVVVVVVVVMMVMVMVVVVVVVVVIVVSFVKNWFGSCSQILRPNDIRTLGRPRGKCCFSFKIN